MSTLVWLPLGIGDPGALLKSLTKWRESSLGAAPQRSGTSCRPERPN